MIILCGKTCSGKNFLRDLLLEQGVQPVVTYTTRPMREGEENGKTYHFLSKDEFERRKEKGFFFESTSYTSASGEVFYYGSNFTKEDDKKIIILNPDGVKALRNAKSLEVTPVVFFIDAPLNTLWERLIERGDNLDNARERLKIDKKDFENIEKCVDFTLMNDGKTPANDIVRDILAYHAEVLNCKPWEPSKECDRHFAKNKQNRTVSATKDKEEEIHV